MSDAAVLYERQNGVAWLTINRPESHNALSKGVRDGLREGFARCAADDAAHVLVLTGAGDRAFCSGGDLKEMAELGISVPPPGFMPHLQRDVKLDKPVIAAVNGIAYGGGFLLAQMCDLCLAADHARLGITEARWGRGAPWAAPLPWMIPPRAALELLLTAEPIGATRAFEIGLVNRVVPAAELRAAAQSLGEQIAANAPLSVRAGKAMVYASAEHGWRDGLDMADALYEPVYLSQDAQEGPRAFTERRAPSWVGR
ncbi:enoyl-CoA hydratase-related protein [Sporichthya sp.]|uniref:enoyl-CoA hydratase/isomerase family protein n=1 Tax=Sporichthya sp. TaxID=65475 RepID=UPI001815FFBE|nr:enoyl-CoA hydratase-related protein [Sporichthya sp.]MBA3741520.1 enoyl-CoA hydratase/isomerase family protein [Sporichthya sp.]